MKHVLIIEDDLAIRENLVELLSDEGYSTSAAANGIEGLRSAQRRRPDLILLDLMMPIMDGWQFRTKQKQDPTLADIPVIALSAHLSLEEIDAAACVPKPFRVDALLAAIERHAA